jgi:hypothetical protein
MQKGSSLKPLAVSLPLPETFFHHSFVRSLTFGHVAIVCNEDQYLQRAVPPVASFTQRRGGGGGYLQQLATLEIYMHCAVMEQKKTTFSDRYAPQYASRRDLRTPVYDPWYSRLFHRPAQCSPGTAMYSSHGPPFPTLSWGLAPFR